MKFIPNSSLKDQMLKEISLSSIDELFKDIPQSIQTKHLDLPDGISQMETERHLRKLAKKNISSQDLGLFTGGGIKPHYIPAVVKSVTSRSEFFTAYTPYQSEASQGFLKAMFEYQSMIASITGMDIANCSLYDGATALGEAALMAMRITKKKKILIPTYLSPEKKSILNNYGTGADLHVKEYAFHKKTGCCDIDNLKKNVDETCSAVYLEIPNLFGILEQDIKEIEQLVHAHDALFIIGIDPLVLGIIQSPGELGADIVIGEGRCLGNPMDFGGSSLGLFACKKQYIRNIPGRIIGLTHDAAGDEAFCMALQTREQHIRRGKATSNICTNEGLCSLAAAVYLSWLGGTGLQEISLQNYNHGQYMKDQICSISGFSEVFDGSHFNEFVIHAEKNVEKINKKLLKHQIQGGLILEPWVPSLPQTFLFGVTENHSIDEINRCVTTLMEVIAHV